MDNVVIIGCGSLGSHIAYYLLQNNVPIKLIDKDIVEKKNLKTSFFSASDVGKKKILAIKEKFPNTEIKVFDSFFEECYTLIPKQDLVINCADRTLIHNEDVDLKCCISGNFLFLDARKDRNEDQINYGKYPKNLRKNDIDNCARFITQFILEGNYIYQFIQSHSSKFIGLDYLEKFNKNEICSKTENSDMELICDYFPVFEHVPTLPSIIRKIVESEHKSDISFKLCLPEEEKHITIPINYQHSFSEVATLLNRFIMEEKISDNTSFLVSDKMYNSYHILPAIGGA